MIKFLNLRYRAALLTTSSAAPLLLRVRVRMEQTRPTRPTRAATNGQAVPSSGASPSARFAFFSHLASLHSQLLKQFFFLLLFHLLAHAFVKGILNGLRSFVFFSRRKRQASWRRRRASRTRTRTRRAAAAPRGPPCTTTSRLSITVDWQPCQSTLLMHNQSAPFLKSLVKWRFSTDSRDLQ